MEKTLFLAICFQHKHNIFCSLTQSSSAHLLVMIKSFAKSKKNNQIIKYLNIFVSTLSNYIRNHSRRCFMKKILSVMAIAIVGVLLVGCTTTNQNIKTNLRSNVEMLRNSISKTATYNSAHLSMPEGMQDINANKDYAVSDEQVYTQDYQEAKDVTTINDTSDSTKPVVTEEYSKNYVADDNLPTTRESTSVYKPRYTSTTTGPDLNNYFERVQDLYAICNDTNCANNILEQLKNSLTGKCDNCLNIIDALNLANLSNSQCQQLYEYCNKLNNCCQNVDSNCCNSCNADTANISNLKNNFSENVDVLSTKYLKVLDCIDCDINTMQDCDDTLSELLDYLDGISNSKVSQTRYNTQPVLPRRTESKNYQPKYYRSSKEYAPKISNKELAEFTKDSTKNMDSSKANTISSTPRQTQHNNEFVYKDVYVPTPHTTDSNKQNTVYTTDATTVKDTSTTDSQPNIVSEDTQTDTKTFSRKTSIKDNTEVLSSSKSTNVRA